jgi:hypothetical protein
MYFDTKSYLKSTRNHTAKHALQQPNSKSLFCFKIDILILIGSFLFFGLQIIREETLLAETIS